MANSNYVIKAMKAPFVAALIFALSASSETSAQSCKPEYSTQDKISKEQTDVWSQVLYKTSFGGSLMGSSEVGITGAVGRYGGSNAVNLQIEKKEESKVNATFESQFQAQEGNRFSFGFKSGDPLTFTASDVSNDTKTGFLRSLVTTVVLSAILADEEIAAMRETLTKKPIDALRVQLAGGVIIDQTVSEKNGQQMMQKFNCFFQALDKAAASPPTGDPALRPLVVRVDSASRREYAAFAPIMFRKVGAAVYPLSYFSFNVDGTFLASWDNGNHHGKYRVHGDSLTFQFLYTSGRAKNSNAYTALLSDSGFVEEDGTAWEVLPGQPRRRATQPKRVTAMALTADQIIQMVAAKVPDDVIITTIRNTSSKFDLTPDLLIKLKKAGVSDAIVRAMAP
jgi:hypothetical protein